MGCLLTCFANGWQTSSAPYAMPLADTCALAPVAGADLGVVPGRKWAFVIPNSKSLDLSGRIISVYRGAHMDYADENTETGTTQLAEGTVPSLDEIEAQREFSPSEISSEEFEAVWVAATQPGSESGP